jgi:Cyclin D1 binding domain
MSHDRLAQYWVPFGHVSFYERVDLEALMQSGPSGMTARGLETIVENGGPP